ncbi:AAA family ATPase [Actinacidiphila acidipaludis]|uniref:AAA family ATPase n=1 Tax=Actinacidiphila acidipaludis TaxID=2873382 RepID=A0ABS7Q970_9ACTN|nr:AAA family ATPase [Streptomyces acidipaludis]MBY8878985.1 AAA family ATPase [Streptomyces acidipaludis]
MNEVSTTDGVGAEDDLAPGFGSLVIVGYPGSGKSTLGSLMGRFTGHRVVEMGDVVRSAAASQSPPMPPMEYADLVFTEKDRPLHFAEKLIAGLRDHDDPLIVVGPRRTEELAVLRDVLAPVLVVGLRVDTAIRRRRQRARLRRAFRPAMLTEWEERDEVERGWGLDTTLAFADHVFDSGVPVEELAQNVLRVWTESTGSV